MNLGQECWVGLTFNRLQKTSHKTIPIDTENRFDKIQHLFMTATLGTLGIEETSLNLTKKKKKSSTEKPQLTSHLIRKLWTLSL